MGIRFNCPNGHKLNVKIFQAGKKGICPYCGAKFLIPTESTRKSTREELASFRVIAQTTNPAAENVPADGLEDVPVSLPRSTPINPSSSPPIICLSDTGEDSPDMIRMADLIAASAQTSPTDPFIGDVVWYVRPPSGGQYGPATADVMRQWLADGRISLDTLVWREGWRDWQQASAVFPQLQTNEPSAETDQAADQTSPSFSRHVYQSRGNRNSQKKHLMIIILIILFVIVIASVILWAVTRGSASAGDNSNTLSTRLELRDTLSSDRTL